jgi:hypothetical protein
LRYKKNLFFFIFFIWALRRMRVAAPFRARCRSVLRTAALGGTLQAANAAGCFAALLIMNYG